MTQIDLIQTREGLWRAELVETDGRGPYGPPLVLRLRVPGGAWGTKREAAGQAVWWLGEREAMREVLLRGLS